MVDLKREAGANAGLRRRRAPGLRIATTVRVIDCARRDSLSRVTEVNSRGIPIGRCIGLKALLRECRAADFHLVVPLAVPFVVPPRLLLRYFLLSAAPVVEPVVVVEEKRGNFWKRDAESRFAG